MGTMIVNCADDDGSDGGDDDGGGDVYVIDGLIAMQI